MNTKHAALVSTIAVAVCITAAVGSAAHANMFTYELNGSLAEANGGPSLVAYGGTLSVTGYNFGPNMGLSVSGTGAFDVYSINLQFYFDSVNASFNGYQRILDFKNRTLDMGLYSLSGVLSCFACGGSGATQVFANGQLVDFRMSRDASGLFSAYVNGALTFSFLDTSGLTTFSGPNNIIHFFMDDFQSLANYPNSPEAGSGFIDRITIQTPPSAVPLHPSIISQLAGLVMLLGLFVWRRKRMAAAGRTNS